jgi:hypothetical protein
MAIKILSLVLVLLGITLIFSAIKYGNKNKANIDDEAMLKKHIKSKQLLYLIEGIFYAIVGLLSLLNIISGKYIGFIILAFVIVDSSLKSTMKLRSVFNDMRK